ncbi:Cytoplasmic and mitochondrial histidine tRNA synthetase [Mucor velutinosus]|uniref:Cytoplasmic and mitochondrial histidine tRNA synthetase n=1 Tax=Mucor velutinosus TaxID=708070 RepID=A0AAN7DJC6_9FUNG|nr:Cytoplasmic and mitochondrial histidine tRNA synthetase [Mucor velutinosus]
MAEATKKKGTLTSIIKDNISSPIFDVKILRDFDIRTKLQAEHALKAAFANARNSKKINNIENLVAQYEKFAYSFINSSTAAVYFGTFNAEQEIIQEEQERDSYHSSVKRQYYQQQKNVMSKKQKTEINQAEAVEDPFDSCPVVSCSNQVSSRSFSILKKGQVYEFSVPAAYISSPHKPYVQENDKQKLENHFEILLKSSQTKDCSTATKKEFHHCQQTAKTNACLRRTEHHFTWIQQCLDLPYEAFDESVIEISRAFKEDKLIQFMKFTLLDFWANTYRPIPIPSNNERTIFVEAFVPIFKYFGNFTKTLAFVWCEKQLNANAVWYMMTDYKKTGLNKKFVDGVGLTYDTLISSLIIESSGYNEKENVEHMLGDTLKNLKNATDCLKHLISEYKAASYTTFKKVKIFSVHIIQDTMTLIQYSVMTPQKWQAIECRSALVPLVWENRDNFVKVFELFSFLLEKLKEQNKVLQLLKREHLGLVEVATGVSVEDVLMHHVED